MESQTAIVCPECGSSKIYSNGTRELKDGSTAQRYLCRKCNYRFSSGHTALKTNLDKEQSSHIGASSCRIAKNMAENTQKTKICVSDKRFKLLPQETKGLIVKYTAYLEREGYFEFTSYLTLIIRLANLHANLLDSEDVKTKIAQAEWKESTKMLAVYAYDLFAKMEGITWSKPKNYKQQETILIVPDERDLDALINATRSKQMATFLQCLKETYADPGEILKLEWREIKGNIIPINHPCKGHLPGQYEVSGRLIAMLNSLPKDSKLVFPTTYRSMAGSFAFLRKRAAQRLSNPNLKEISFKSYRHFGGSMLAYYTNGNVLKVKAALRHKRVENTMKYIHTINNYREEDFEETVATTPEEIRKLGKAGWTKYDEMTTNGVTMHFYRKPKKFGVNFGV
jgi:integrase/predicted RNA-binding Zn-ribbon protein involved in translation (DUF1610 family)